MDTCLPDLPRVCVSSLPTGAVLNLRGGSVRVPLPFFTQGISVVVLMWSVSEDS